MPVWEAIQHELIDIIEWFDSSFDTFVYRFERYNNEISYRARLVVREGQTAVFVDDGRLADVFGPGTHTLESHSLCGLSALQGWKQGFASPFKSEIYFVSTRRFTDLKWGTKNPIMLRDAEFGPVRLRAFGSSVVRVTDPAKFVREIVAPDGRFTADEMTGQLRNMIVSRLAEILSDSGIPGREFAGNYDKLGRFVTQRLQPEFAAYGLALTKMIIENIALPSALEQAADKRSATRVGRPLDACTRRQLAAARKAAPRNGNGNGTAAGGAEMGLGLTMAGHLGEAAIAGRPTATPSRFQPSQRMHSRIQPPPIKHDTLAVPVAKFVQYFVVADGRQTGPFDSAALEEQIRDGTLHADSLVWCQGRPRWIPAAQIKTLDGRFTPPPVPV